MNRILFYFVIVAFQNIAANLAHPITPTLIKSLNLPNYMFGLMYAGMAGTNFLFSPFWGKLADYFNSKRIMLIGCCGYAAGQFLFWHSQTIATIMFARCLSGFFVAAIGVCTLTYLVNISLSEERGKYLTIFAAVQTVCSSFGYLIGGLLGEISLSLSFGLQVLLLALCGIAFECLLIRDCREKPAFSGKGMLRDVNPFSAFLAGKKFMTISFAILFAIVLFSVFASTAYDQCFNYYIKDQFGMSSVYNGTIKAAIGIISLIANMTLCMYIIKKTNVAKSNAIILFVGMLLMTGVVSTGNLYIFILFTILYLAINAISVPVIQSLITDKAEQKTSNLVMGFYNAIKSLGGVLGALFAGFIYEAGPKLPFLFAACSFGIAFLFSVIYIFQKRKEDLI